MKGRRSFSVLCFCLLGLGTAVSEIFAARPPVDLFLGYSYVNLDTSSATPRQSLNGWSSSSSVHVSRWLALEGEASGYYSNNVADSGVDAREYSFTAGPRINLPRRFFAHALFGDDHLAFTSGSSALQPAITAASVAVYGGGLTSSSGSTGSSSSSSTPFSVSQDSFVMIFGGGLQWKHTKGWSVRSSIDYVGTHHNGLVQNNVRVGGGVVYTIHPRRPLVARE